MKSKSIYDFLLVAIELMILIILIQLAFIPFGGLQHVIL
jgi:hypothetical protein